MEHRMNKNGNRIILPGWMEAEVECEISGGLRIKRRHDFLRKSISQMKRSLSEELLTERYATQNGLLQSMDARVKLVVALSFIIVTGLIRSFPILFGLWTFTAILMLLSKIPVFTFKSVFGELFPF